MNASYNNNNNSRNLLNNDVKSMIHTSSQKSFDLNNNKIANKMTNDLNERRLNEKESSYNKNNHQNDDDDDDKKKKFSKKTKFFASVCFVGLTSWLLGKLYLLNTEVEEHVSFFHFL